MPNSNNSNLEKITNETMAIISRYVNSCATHEVPDYYHIFQLDREEKDLEKNKKKLRKALGYFLPEQLVFFEKVVQDPIVTEFFKEISAQMPSIVDILTDEDKKAQYDAELKEEHKETKDFCKVMLETLNNNSGDKFQEVIRFEDKDKKKILETYEPLAKVIGTNMCKKGTKYAMEALKVYLEAGYRVGFTREDDSRKIIDSLDKEKVARDLYSLWGTDDLFEVSQNTVNLILNEKIFILFKACVFTFHKYGKAQLEAALYELISEYPSYRKFTDDLGVRTELKKNITPSEALYILATATHVNGFNHFGNGAVRMTQAEIDQAVNLFVTTVDTTSNQLYTVINTGKQRARQA